MSFDLPAMAKARGLRRSAVTLRPINPAPGLATDLAAIYAPAWQVWRDAKAAIMASYDAVPIGDGLTLDTASQTDAVIQSAATEFLTRLVTTITPALSRWVVRAEQVHRSRWVSAVVSGVGIDLASILTGQPVAETLEVALARNVALVTNVSDQARSRISDAVFRGYQNRTPAREVAKEIDEAVGLGRKRTVRIASDQNAKLSATLDTERQVEAGIEFFKWRHSGKAHPREQHRAREGKVYEIKSGKERAGSGSVPADDRPGMAPFCGCRAQAWIALMDEIE